VQVINAKKLIKLKEEEIRSEAGTLALSSHVLPLLNSDAARRTSLGPSLGRCHAFGFLSL
jgi:hypothetical protein